MTSEERRERAIELGRWTVLGALVGVLCGAASALFLWLLEEATRFRGEHLTLVFALPVAGLAIGFFYERFGSQVLAGSDLVLDTVAAGEVGDDGIVHAAEAPPIPTRMAPMVLVGTVLTHLFGGSAGREGTAVQMGASLADALSHRLKVAPAMRRDLLVAGMAGGFGSVFGTPIAGLLFGLEVATVGRFERRPLLPALVAAVVGDRTTHAFGIGHTHYPSPEPLALTPLVFGKWLVFAVAIAAATAVFIELTHVLKVASKRFFVRLPYRLFAGGALVVLLWQVVGTDDYLGLGVPTIVRAFEDPELPRYAFALKLLFTAITLGAGFFGGEVTPLFFLGAALGNALAHLLGLPLELAAGVGLAAVFAAASNTPVALSIMAVELLGANVLPHVVIVAVVAYFLTGHRSIYGAQRVGRTKGGRTLSPPVALRDLGKSAAPERAPS
ncbi:MAG: chloride channel protein [Polyangiales bacterium]